MFPMIFQKSEKKIHVKTAIPVNGAPMNAVISVWADQEIAWKIPGPKIFTSVNFWNKLYKRE